MHGGDGNARRVGWREIDQRMHDFKTKSPCLVNSRRKLSLLTFTFISGRCVVITFRRHNSLVDPKLSAIAMKFKTSKELQTTKREKERNERKGKRRTVNASTDMN